MQVLEGNLPSTTQTSVCMGFELTALPSSQDNFSGAAETREECVANIQRSTCVIVMLCFNYICRVFQL